MTKVILITAIILSAFVSAETIRFRDGSGHNKGMATKAGDTTYYRDKTGRIESTARPVGQHIIYRDGSGHNQGQSQQVGSHTYYRDSHGQVSIVAQPVGSMTVYRDGSGKNLGRSQIVGDRVIYYDAHGKNIGTASKNDPNAVPLIFNKH